MTGNFDYTPHLRSMLVERGLTDDSEIRYVINRITNTYRSINDPCNDNFRLSVNGKQDSEYDEIRSSGCCGFWDDVIELYSGNTVKFGFNYGH